MQFEYPLDEIIDRIKRLKNYTKDLQVAKLIGLLPHDFSKRKKSGTLLTPIVKWAINDAIDLNWLLRGQKTQPIEYDGKIESNDVISQKDDDPYSEYGELLYKTKEILQSGTEFSNSLSANIHSFHNAMKNERRIDLLERKMDLLEVENGRLKREGLIERRKIDRRRNNIAVDHERRSGKDRRKSII